MRYRLMATYRGVPYEAGLGPTGGNVVLFAACPPPEELGFEPATGHWRKQVMRPEVDALWESRPVGVFRGEPCIVLDDLGERLHIAYLGTDAGRAASLGYWQVDRGVFELLTSRDDVTGLTEERVDKPVHWSEPPGGTGTAPADPYGTAPWPVPAAPAAGDADPVASSSAPPAMPTVAPGSPGAAPEIGFSSGPAVDHGGRAARRQRVPTREIFCELADLASIPRAAYALETETDGAMCLLPTPEGFEVFIAADGARHEVRSFADEEAAYFYMFGVLAAEAIRNGSLTATVSGAGHPGGSFP